MAPPRRLVLLLKSSSPFNSAIPPSVFAIAPPPTSEFCDLLLLKVTFSIFSVPELYKAPPQELLPSKLLILTLLIVKLVFLDISKPRC